MPWRLGGVNDSTGKACATLVIAEARSSAFLTREVCREGHENLEVSIFVRQVLAI